jgi:peptide/nickel transport system substrate-binding protein
MSSNYPAVWPLMQSMEGLVQFDKDMNLQVLLAESRSISDDGLVYTFNIDKNVYFHDDVCFPDGKGRKLTSYDFKYCFERVCDPRTKTRGAWLFRDRVKGAVEYNNSIQSGNLPQANDVKEISGIQCPDSFTLVITLNKPFAPFLSILTMAYAFVYPHEAVEYYKDNFGYHPVGTGQYKFVKWEFDKELVFEKNQNYWKKNKTGNPLVYLDGIKITFTRSSETEFLDFKEGRLDY